jgi:hypothetical protein
VSGTVGEWHIRYSSDLDLDRKGLWYNVTKGPDFSTSTAKPETDLTAEMMTSYVPELSLRRLLNRLGQQWRLENLHV